MTPAIVKIYQYERGGGWAYILKIDGALDWVAPLLKTLPAIIPSLFKTLRFAKPQGNSCGSGPTFKWRNC